jgi:signal transduction histidine kinase
VDPFVADGRFAPAAEAAVYFCVLEALQNCSKHAPEASVRVRLQRESEVLIFCVSDDGKGFEPDRTNGGTGLQGMADRVAGRRLRVDSVPGRHLDHRQVPLTCSRTPA